MPVGPSGIIASAPRYGGGNNTHASTHNSHTAVSNTANGYYTRTNGGHTTTFPASKAPVPYYSNASAIKKASYGTSIRESRVSTATTNTRTSRGKTPPSTHKSSYASNTYQPLRAATPGRRMTVNPSAQMRPASYDPWQSRRRSRVTLILDLDETLVHSSFEPVARADLHIPVVLDGERYVAYVKKRPYVEQFLVRCLELFDVVIWTASLAVYAEPLIAELCKHAKCSNMKQMYRDSCTQLPGGGYVKDLSVMGRSLDDVCILDNSPAVAQLQPDNLIPIVSWYDDMRDTCLKDLIPHLERLAMTESVVDVIPSLPGC